MKKQLLIWSASLCLGMVSVASLAAEVGAVGNNGAAMNFDPQVEAMCDCKRQGNQWENGGCKRLAANDLGDPNAPGAKASHQ